MKGGEKMTTRLELEKRGLGKRETLVEIGDKAGVYETSAGEVRLGILFSNSRKGIDIVFDFGKAKALQDKVGSKIRRISVGGNGKGSQEIGKEAILFVSTDIKGSRF